MLHNVCKLLFILIITFIEGAFKVLRAVKWYLIIKTRKYIY